MRTSVIAAISSTGYELHTGGVSGEEFYDFVRGTLIPNMSPFDGDSDNSILILDNCSIHHVESVLTLLQQSGILVLFLPPYSPDFNPIELTFSYVKKYLQEHNEVIQATNNRDVLKSALDSISGEYCSKWMSNCGYSKYISIWNTFDRCIYTLPWSQYCLISDRILSCKSSYCSLVIPPFSINWCHLSSCSMH